MRRTLGALAALALCGVSGVAPAAASGLQVRIVGSLPVAASRVAAVTLPGGRVLALGGLVAGASSDQVLLGRPSRLLRVGSLPQPSHDAAAVLSGGQAWRFGGGSSTTTAAIVRIDPARGGRPA